ncbi:MAG TPA: alpha/beta hydrolase [Mycobacteriales bacterium]|nr:alpha/beta hydrolase [Mycobacteriales bacterium]
MRLSWVHGAVAVVLCLLVATPAHAAQAADGDPGTPTITLTGPPPISDVVTTTGWYTPHHAETITLFSPAGDGQYPAVVFVHGGAWGRAQPNSYELDWARDLAAKQHWVVAVIGYPTKVHNEQVVEPDALAEAITSVSKQSDVDSHAIALWGESAGGQLALLAGYRDAMRLHPLVSGVVSISGPTDMRTEFSSLAQRVLGAVTRFEGLTPRAARLANSPRYRVTSPVDLVRRSDPATFQAISRHDQLVPPAQVTRLTRLLANADVPHRTVWVSGTAHSTTLESRRPAGSDRTVQQLAVAYLERLFAAQRVRFA